MRIDSSESTGVVPGGRAGEMSFNLFAIRRTMRNDSDFPQVLEKR
jgi:hypothetical protein